MKTVWRDMSCGLRMLGRNPGLAFVAILIIAIGTGASASLSGYLKAILHRNIAEQGAEQLVVLAMRESDGPASLSFSYPMYLDVRATKEEVTGAAANGGVPVELVRARGAERVRGELVSGNYFRVLGAHPWLGRLITESDDNAASGQPVAVISYEFWKRWFGGDPSVINQALILNAHRVTVIGITAPGFHGTSASNTPDIQVPLSMTRIFHPMPGKREPRATMRASLRNAEVLSTLSTNVINAVAIRPRSLNLEGSLDFN